MSRTPGFVDYKWQQEFRRQIEDWTDDQCRAGWNVIKERWNAVHTNQALEAASKFHIGQRVQFRSSRGRGTVQGTIEKINVKTVVLKDCSDGSIGGWRVSPSMLEPATEIKGTDTKRVSVNVPDLTVGADDRLEVVTSEDGKERTWTFIYKKDFTKAEWDTLLHGVKRGLLFRDKRPVLYGALCCKEYGGGCGENKKLLVRAKKVGPEVVSLLYRCIGCGTEDSDVMD